MRKSKLFALSLTVLSIFILTGCDDAYIEAQYKQGNLSYEDYRNQEQALEDIEDKLDASEDRLERTFGIND